MAAKKAQSRAAATNCTPWLQALILAGALVVGLGISATLLIAAGVKPSALFEEFIIENFSDPENLHSIFVQAAPLIFVGVGAALAFRVSLSISVSKVK